MLIAEINEWGHGRPQKKIQAKGNGQIGENFLLPERAKMLNIGAFYHLME